MQIKNPCNNFRLQRMLNRRAEFAVVGIRNTQHASADMTGRVRHNNDTANENN